MSAELARMQAARLTESGLVATKLGELLESMPDAIVVANGSGRIVLANSQAEALFGYERGELVAAPIEVLLPERFRTQHVTHRTHYSAGPHTRTMGAGLELFGLRRDGSEFPVEIGLSPLDTQDGPLVMSAVRDITRRRHAERKFRDLLKAAPDAMVIVNARGLIELVNSQTERLFGYAREGLLGQPVEILVPERFRGRHPHHRDHFFEQPRVRAMGAGLELFGLRADGSEFPVEISLSPLETEDGILVSSAIRDVTQSKLIKQALRDKNVELEDAARVKDRFLASMSHELRTPLNAIIGFTGTLLMRLPGPLTADQERQLTTVQTSARHLHSLINDLLDLAKIEAGHVELLPERVDASDVLREIAALLQPSAKAKGLDFQVDVPASSCIVMTDRRALTQILLNLANNAIKFTDHGRVHLNMSFPSQPAGTVSFTVVDTGSGITAEDQQRLFQSFQQFGDRAPKRDEGAGLGLHLSKKLALLLGGDIACRSQPGEGSTFELTLAGSAP